MRGKKSHDEVLMFAFWGSSQETVRISQLDLLLDSPEFCRPDAFSQNCSIFYFAAWYTQQMLLQRRQPLRWSHFWLLTATGPALCTRHQSQDAGRLLQGKPGTLPLPSSLTDFWIYPWPLKIVEITAFSFIGIIASKSYALEFNYKIPFSLLRAVDILIDSFSFITLF